MKIRMRYKHFDCQKTLKTILEQTFFLSFEQIFPSISFCAAKFEKLPF
jgi:hypothetical protein